MKATRLIQLEHRLRAIASRVVPSSTWVRGFSEKRSAFLKALAQEELPTIPVPDRPYENWGLTFRNDVGNAAGLDKDGTLLDFNYRLGAGFAVVGTSLNRTHTGNLYTVQGKTFNPWTPLPNSRSAINSLGLPGKGIDPVIDRIKAFLDQRQPVNFPIGMSVMGHPAQKGQSKIDGVVECLEKSLPHVDFVEINESCPNVSNHDPEAFQKRIATFVEVRNSLKPNLPIWVKFGQIPDPTTLQSLDTQGVQGVVLLNTQTDYDHFRERIEEKDRRIFDYYVRNFRGGVSGKLIYERGVEAVSHARLIIDSLHLNLEVIHVGGLFNKTDMDASRIVCPLREWYTGLMDALGRVGPERVYSSLF